MIGTDTATVTIHDNDSPAPPELAFNPTAYTVSENGVKYYP